MNSEFCGTKPAIATPVVRGGGEGLRGGPQEGVHPALYRRCSGRLFQSGLTRLQTSFRVLDPPGFFFGYK